ncbi:homoserine kinase [Sedimentibacter acidaminivorans]|uniref:Homoserine kinase n=1 Tax=Sedimentibacter acidaminivorans TaxID=913099 RepID=A0ABS4GI75_9FIRM|nr:homoserine kinase [Sedimentibacter acidaminivorans]MBP1927401.1 homoserine kinase [Sedimentibacter acidaminivorans]
MIKVTVPASTANIGPGFDSLGLALNLYNTYEFEEIENGIIIEGCIEEYCNENNLVYKSFKTVADKIGRSFNGLKINMETQIPVSRGLGSSSACIVGGVFGANALFNGNLSKDELFKIAVEIEGHPDNIAPAVYGGLTASLVDDDVPYYVHYEISEKILFCALIPDFETSTSEARKLLPQMVSLDDAIYNVSRIAALLKSLEAGDFNMIKMSLKDKLHQAYRRNLIHEYDEVEKICMENNSVVMFISGSGPTLMNIIENSDFTKAINNSIIELKHKWEIKFLNVDKNGVLVEK